MQIFKLILFSPFSIISVDFIFLYFRVKTENQVQLQADLYSCFLGHYQKVHIIYLGDIYAFFIEIFYVLEGEKNAFK